MPFALIGFAIGIKEYPNLFSWRLLLLVLLCMIFARSAAMSFNRYLDREIDSQNPRTANREIPAGVLSSRSVLLFVALNSIGFVICAGFINKLCLFLSPIALLIILGYSYTKRFTSLCHFILGLGLSLAPIGAYIAVTETISPLILLFGLVVFFWVAGFDIIYSLQDEEFDNSLNLKSTASKLGKLRALWVSNIVHLVSVLSLIAAAYLAQMQFPNLGILLWVGVVLFSFFIYYQHRLVKPNDLSKINLAFFTSNGIASVLFATIFIVDLFY